MVTIEHHKETLSLEVEPIGQNDSIAIRSGRKQLNILYHGSHSLGYKKIPGPRINFQDPVISLQCLITQTNSSY